jgi:hypothetical protein
MMGSIGPNGGVTVVQVNSSMPSNGLSPFNVPPTEDSFRCSKPNRNTRKQKQGGFFHNVKEFVAGFASGVAGMFSLKSMAMAAGAVVVGTLMPWTIPLMVVGGIGLNGYGMVKAIKKGDYKEAGTKAFGLGISFMGARSFVKPGTVGASGEAGAPADFISLENGKALFTGKFDSVRASFNSTMSRSWSGLKSIGSDLRGNGNFYGQAKANDVSSNWKNLIANPWQSTKNVFGAMFLGKQINGSTGEAPITAIQAGTSDPTTPQAP